MSLSNELSALRSVDRRGPSSAALLTPGEDIHVMISANVAGDNPLIEPQSLPIQILELYLWNGVAAQTLTLTNGLIPLLRLTGLPASSGTMLGYTGTGKPHFTIAAGNAFNLNLSVGSLVDGFIKYRTA